MKNQYVIRIEDYPIKEDPEGVAEAIAESTQDIDRPIFLSEIERVLSYTHAYINYLWKDIYLIYSTLYCYKSYQYTPPLTPLNHLKLNFVTNLSCHLFIIPPRSNWLKPDLQWTVQIMLHHPIVQNLMEPMRMLKQLLVFFVEFQ